MADEEHDGRERSSGGASLWSLLLLPVTIVFAALWRSRPDDEDD